ncbi:Putative diguanylate phosphodiesterase (EAL domain) with Response Regulator Receiver modulation [Trichormus variabilis ATCC 29413]|uniref:Diguanylate phosphodiesterase (EAL domain) with Response Regulator Receiver modulation n=3 Tax=Anabaena variabilis TaxID=264691 RepID=Q3MFG4_TRIV2|nr:MULTISPECIES: EAL domain-containing response regulator [Nostocaceae]ABA20272.1 Putative diguanylate phosphodiesterase (EAL domain) with Response Regulator Receiver modulation [Trichormus variabilis ATCC 29413]MBC1212750.1 EAL domain-containing response regulator [Trichormus variabilis ARAD]MBC1269521.1 EAL domain-containing response regulator [Trichormus variabilis FSR]MBC1304150.1 EAL domain-containing response regulator [Trichormus variabilis N2B]MBC1313080.1 EAL domain-containing respons
MIKILVIEDEESVRENILDLLQAEDFHTVSAANGRIGINLALAEFPDLILCDMMMPEVDGYGVLSALRQEPLTATIPFIFLTAKSAKADFRQGMDMGADDYLTKPFTRAELLSAVMNRLERQATLKKYLINQNGIKISSPKTQLLEMSLHKVIQQQKFQEFEVQYQPIVDIASGKIVAAESLLRWHSPELGFVSPSEFIPLAESTGLIVPIGQWVIANVCHQIKSWHDSGVDFLTISVNLSAMEFNKPDLIQRITESLKTNNIAPHYLEIELTESMIMQDLNSAIFTMNKLQSLGVRLAIDDFGTGYSSLIYLKNLPVNTLKIDRYFIHNVAKDKQKSAITKALVEMAHNMNMQVVAEGVETESELYFLKQNKCDAMQGFLFSRPLPAVEFENFLWNNKHLSV